MKPFTALFLSGFIIFFLSCSNQPVDMADLKTPLIPKDTNNQNERRNKLFVFVGEKIKVTPMPVNRGEFDGGVHAKYLILQRVYGFYVKDTIEFEAYDHYRRFPFAEYKNVLLYISEHEGKYYQEKYMFNPVFKTKDGRWAGPYSNDYKHPYNKNTSVLPEKIDFAEEVSFPTKKYVETGNEFMISYEEPYYKLVGDKAIPIYGNFVPELFRLKKEGVLTARGLFGDRNPETE